MRKTSIIFILILSLIMNNNMRESYGFKKISEVSSKYYNMKCLNFYVSGHVNIMNSCNTKEDFENKVWSLMHFMNISEDNASVAYDEPAEKISGESKYMNGKIGLTVENNTGYLQKGQGCTMVLDITQYGSMENIYDIGKKVRLFLEGFGPDPDVNFCITEYVPGKVSDSTRQKIIDSFMESLNARKIDNISSEGLISVCGYSDILEKPVSYGSSLMNVNIGCRYDSFDNITCFLIGTPIINVEY